MTEIEYKDLQDMMVNKGLYEMDNTEEYYTWSNKHKEGTVYSRIDRVLGNVGWFQSLCDTVLKILPPSVSDHALLLVTEHI